MNEKIPENPIVTVTGTKGKTSLVRLLDDVLKAQWPSVVRVETSGAYHNGKLKFDDEQSRELWGYSSTNAPGRFISLHDKQPSLSLLEATLFSAHTGLAYKKHDVGVFTNVYEDHLGAFSKLSSPQDIARMKNFVFRRLQANGTAIYNADDPLVCEQLVKIPAAAKKIAVSLTLREPVHTADYTCSIRAKAVTISDKQGKTLWAIPMEKLTWLNTSYEPSCYLALFALAVLFSLASAKSRPQIEQALQDYQFDPLGGRMVKLDLVNGASVIMDYAHEKVSLHHAAKLARSLSGTGHKVIGVLRLAPSRQEELVTDTAQAIYKDFDEFVIYDKVDGHFRQPKSVKGYTNRIEKIGQMAEQFTVALKACGPKPVYDIIREDEAIQKAIYLSCPGDVIVYIVGDDSARSRKFLESSEAKEAI